MYHFSATTGISFGGLSQPAAPAATGSTFGTPNPAQPVSFGIATPQPAAVGFGAPATQASFSFGTPSATVQPQPQQPATTGFSFGTPTAAKTVAPTLSFNPTTPATTSTTGITLGTIGFGSSATTATITSTAPTLSFGTPQTTAQATTGFSLGAPATTSSAPSLTFGTAAPTLSLGGVQPATTQASFGSLLPPPSTTVATTTPSVGLGGIDINANKPQVTNEGKPESTKVKETQVPKEIIQSVEEFKTYLKQQKTLSSDIVRTSDRKLKSVTEEIQRLNCSVQEVSINVDNNKLAIKLLRADTSRIIQHADMAQRTHETPTGLQFENVLPQIYFNELIHKYENDLLTLKHQVELTEKHLQSLSNPQNFTGQDLKRGLQQLHESFIALAGRVQDNHTKTEAQKEQYLNIRKFALRDNTNVFEVAEKSNENQLSKVQFGPNPFSNNGMNISSASKWSNQTSSPNQ